MCQVSPPFGLVTVICAPVPVTPCEIGDVRALDVKVTFRVKVPVAVGLNRTTTAWFAPAARLKELPETTEKGAVVAALPVRVPPPVFWTVNVRSDDVPTGTLPKSCEGGVTLIAGFVEGRVHRSAVPSESEAVLKAY